MDAYDRFIQKVNGKIQTLGITKQSISERIDVSKTLLTRNLLGKNVKRGMSARAAFDIAMVLGISKDECINEE